MLNRIILMGRLTRDPPFLLPLTAIIRKTAKKRKRTLLTLSRGERRRNL